MTVSKTKAKLVDVARQLFAKMGVENTAPFVILFPRKIMSLEVTGSSSNNVARW